MDGECTLSDSVLGVRGRAGYILIVWSREVPERGAGLKDRVNGT